MPVTLRSIPLAIGMGLGKSVRKCGYCGENCNLPTTAMLRPPLPFSPSCDGLDTWLDFLPLVSLNSLNPEADSSPQNFPLHVTPLIKNLRKIPTLRNNPIHLVQCARHAAPTHCPDLPSHPTSSPAAFFANSTPVSWVYSHSTTSQHSSLPSVHLPSLLPLPRKPSSPVPDSYSSFRGCPKPCFSRNPL